MRKIVLALIMLTLISCGQKQERKELYCGQEMSSFEVMDYKAMNDKGFTYNAADKDLYNKLLEGITNHAANDVEVQLSFAHKDNDKIALLIIAPSDKAIVEKISCYLLQANLDGFPKNRNLLFYTNEHNTLVAAVKNK